MQLRLLSGLGAALGLGAAGVLATPAAAMPEASSHGAGGAAASTDAPAASGHGPQGVAADVLDAAERSEARAYWTRGRMAAARPMLPEQAADRAKDVRGLLGLDVDFDIDLGLDSSGEAQPVAGPPEGRGRPQAQSSGGGSTSAERQDPSDSPHVGKVFFSTDDGDYVCSGNLVESGNESTVTTAGHCAVESGTFVENFVFAPAYDSGQSEHGLWAAEELATTTQWAHSGDYEYDAAFAVLETKNGTTATDEVGEASPIAFNRQRGLFYSAYGYPAASPYDGQSLHRCQGAAQDDPYGSTTQGIPCDMTGGASGGPWFIGDGSDGAQNSVNSYSYRDDPDTMYGPYFGPAIEEVYTYAASR